jgi:mono/diheme cytochrome c family protein
VDGRGLPRGRAIYRAHCLSCHGEEGSGSPLTSMSLREAVRSLDGSAVSSFTAEGIPGTVMPAFGKTLSADQVADLVAFVKQLPGPPAKGSH